MFPLALPGYIAGAALVFVKVFDDLGTPLVLNVTNMLAPQAYLRITSIGLDDPIGYVIALIMVVFSIGALALSAWIMKGRDYATLTRGGVGAAASGRSTRRQRGARLRLGRCSCWLLVLSPHLGLLLLSLAKVWCFTVLPDGYTLAHYAPVFTRLQPDDLQHAALLRARRRHRRRARHRDRLSGAAHAAARPAVARLGRDRRARDSRRRARHRLPAHLPRRGAAVHRRRARRRAGS